MISVIVPVWNRADLTMKFVTRHWQFYHRRPDFELVVIDNGSTDPTPVVLKQWANVFGDRLKVIRNDENRGFGAANNQGAAAANGDVLVFVSNDVMINGDYLTPIEKYLVGAGDVLIGAELLSHDTGWNTFRQGNERITIPYLAGWCVACTWDTWQALGGWDERYFPSDYEDIDLSYTAVQQGVELVAVRLPLQHLFGQSARQIDGGREAVTRQNRQKFMDKWGLQE